MTLLERLLIVLVLVTTLAASQQQLQKSPCPHAIKINTNYQFRNELHFVCLQSTGGLPRLEIIRYATGQRILSHQVNDLGTDQMVSFVDQDGTLRILLAVSSRLNGTSMYSFASDEVLADETHTINTQYVSAMNIWRLELDYEWQLAIANQPTYDLLINHHQQRQPLPDPKPMISIHSWRSTYFDLYQLIQLPQDGRINKLEPMHINGQEFLVVAMESHRVDHLPRARYQPPDVHSLIYKLDYGDGSLQWALYQTLNTKLTLDVKAFTIRHQNSVQVDYYFVMLGQTTKQRETISHSSTIRVNQTGAMEDGGEYGLTIYKYFGDQFVSILSMPVPGATKLDTIAYEQGDGGGHQGTDSYVVIALLSERSNHVSLYLFNGLQLKVLPLPAANGPSIAPSPPPAGRHRRTMEATNLHLFLVPTATTATMEPIEGESGNDTSKRAAPPTPALPALAFARTNPQLSFGPNGSAMASSGGSVDTSGGASGELVYQIPVHEISMEDHEEVEKNDSSHSKRNMIGQNNLISANSLLQWCQATVSSLLRDSFETVASRLSTLPKIDQAKPIELNGDLIIEDDLHVSNLLYVNSVTDIRRTMVVNESPDFSPTFAAIQKAHLEIDGVKRLVDNILVDDGSPQDIFTPLTFEHLVVDCLNPANYDPRYQLYLHGAGPCPYVEEIITDLMNNRNISKIQSQALVTGRAMTIEGDVRFEHLVLRGTSQIMNTLNGLAIDDIVFKEGPSPVSITGHKSFKNGLFSSTNLQVMNWNSNPYTVDALNYLVSSGDQRIEADLHLNQVVLDSLPTYNQNESFKIGILNGRDLTKDLSKIVLASENNQLQTVVEFDELILNGPVHLGGRSFLSTVDINQLFMSAMLKDATQNITAPMIFDGNVHISYGGNVHVSGPINGVFMNPDNVLMRNRNYNITRPVVFTHDLNVRDFQLLSSLNDIPLMVNEETRALELSILYSGGHQVITGSKIINDLALGGHSTIMGQINGNLNITHLNELLNNLSQAMVFSSVHLAASNIKGVADNAHVHVEKINGVPANHICGLAVSLANSTTFKQYNKLRFEHPVTFKKIHCGAINGFSGNLANTFLTRYGNQHVAGTLKLSSGAIFNSTTRILQSLNSMDITPLSVAIGRIVNETKTGTKDLNGDFLVDDLVVDKINNLRMDNVFMTKSDTPQVIRAPMIFDHLDIENVLTVGHLSTGFFNGLNISDLISNTLQYDTPQVIHKHVQLNTLQIMPGANLLTKHLNGFDLQRLYADAVLVDVPQQILAPKTFRGPVEFANSLSIRHGIDGLTHEDWRINQLLLSDEMIEGDLEFNTELIIRKELDILSRMINDVDIKSFVDSMLYEKGFNNDTLRIVGNGSVTFRDVRLNDLIVGGTIQGIDLSKEAIVRRPVDFVNGTSFNQHHYEAQLRQQQAYLNNQRLIETNYGPGSSFRVASQYQGNKHQGNCYVHSCLHHSSVEPVMWPPASPPPPPPPPPSPQLMQPLPIHSTNYTYPEPYLPPPKIIERTTTPPPNVQGYYQPAIPEGARQLTIAPPIKYVQQFYPNIQPARPMHFKHPARPQLNTTIDTDVAPIWQPNWDSFHHSQPEQKVNATYPVVTDYGFQHHANMMQLEAIKDLANRINRYLPIALYYEIFQKQALFGPPLHAPSYPFHNEEVLFVKAGPHKKQPIAVHRRPANHLFSEGARLEPTSRPTLMDSVVASLDHYLFVLDTFPEEAKNLASHLLVYSWNKKLSMFDLKERIVVPQIPTAMKAFAAIGGQRACVALANPLQREGQLQGSPMLYCQPKPGSPTFDDRRVLAPLQNVFDLDITISSAGGSEIILATLSKRANQQIGVLDVVTYDLSSQQLVHLSQRQVVSPLKLRLFLARSPRAALDFIQLVVTEAITSNQDAQATTRIYSMTAARSNDYNNSTSGLVETQAFRDNQSYDVQTVRLDDKRSLIFLQSAHSIAIYAPLGAGAEDGCYPQYANLLRLPTKGANKFLVFNDQSINNSSRPAGPYGHFLILSNDDCDHAHKYSTLILRAKFE